MKFVAENVGRRIKQLRVSKKLKQRDLAKVAGVTPAAVSKIETGGVKDVSAHVILALAKVLKCTAEYLLYGDETIQQHYENVFELESFKGAETINGKTSFALKVEGVSMSPIIDDGCVAYINTMLPPQNLNYVLISTNGNLYIRQLIIEGGQKFLKATNPEWPLKIVPITSEDIIIGTVISVRKNLVNTPTK